jgi:phytoene dehydrogenase-like protein
LTDALFTPFPPVRAGLSLLRELRTAGLVRLGRRAVTSVRQLGSELFDGDGARLALAGCALHTDLGPEEAGGGIYGWLLAMLAQQVGWPVPVGGAQRITDTLAKRFRGTIVTGAPVSDVVIAGGVALGVRAEDGRRWRARRAVLADVPAPTLYRRLVGAGHLPRQVLEDLEGFRWDHGTLKVDYALSAPLDWIAEEANRAGTIHVGTDVDGLAKYAYELAIGRPPSEPFLLLGQMTTADRTRSPAGTESLWAYTHVPHGAAYDVGEQGISGVWDRDECERFADRMQARIERLAPGFGSAVRSRRVLGPRELEARNANLIGGAVNGGTAQLHQELVFRPVPGLGRAETGIAGLYLGSAAAHPGGGVHGAAGSNAARAALFHHRLRLGR